MHGDNDCCIFVVCDVLHAELYMQFSRHGQQSVFCHRQGSRGRSTTFTTPHGLTLAFQNLLPPSSTSSSRFGSLVRWVRSTGPQWCIAVLGLDAQGHWPWWTPAWSWWEQWGGMSPNAVIIRGKCCLMSKFNKELKHYTRGSCLGKRVRWYAPFMFILCDSWEGRSCGMLV